MNEPAPYFATALKGTEGVLRDELRELGLPRVHATRGGVSFGASDEDAWRACLWSRIASRILRCVAHFEAETPEALYDGVRTVDWTPFTAADRTLAVFATLKDSAFRHSGWVAQKTKDAIVDQLRDQTGARPSVDADDPDLRVSVHIVGSATQVYVDFSGEALHRRGYRRDHAEAPLKENLAAAILRLSGWDRRSPLLDPMCGSGTFAIEAALWAMNAAPGAARRFGFERWPQHDEGARTRFAALHEAALDGLAGGIPEVLASDRDEAAVAATRANARAAGVRVDVQRKDAGSLGLPPGAPGWLVTNPPYGERLQATPGLFRDLALAFERLRGWNIAVLQGDGERAFERLVRPQYSTHTLANGAIPCRLVRYQVP